MTAIVTEVDLVLNSVNAWTKLVEGTPVTNKGLPQRVAFNTTCETLEFQAVVVLNKLTSSALKMSVGRLVTELKRPRDHWLAKVAIIGRGTEVNYYINTIKGRVLSSALGFISGVVAMMNSRSDLEFKEVPWVYEPIGGVGLARELTPDELAFREAKRNINLEHDALKVKLAAERRKFVLATERRKLAHDTLNVNTEPIGTYDIIVDPAWIGSTNYQAIGSVLATEERRFALASNNILDVSTHDVPVTALDAREANPKKE